MINQTIKGFNNINDITYDKYIASILENDTNTNKNNKNEQYKKDKSNIEKLLIDIKNVYDEYIKNMKSDQEQIYFCVANNYQAAINSPHIEKLKSKGIEVLLLIDRIDEWLMTNIHEYKEKQLVNVAKEEISKDIDESKANEKNKDIIEKIKTHLSEKVSDVLVSERLIDSASCLILPQSEPGAQLRKILEASGQNFGDSKPIFEINIKHKLFKKLKDMKGKQFNLFVDFLYDYALIAEGGSPKDPSRYLRQLDKYLT